MERYSLDEKTALECVRKYRERYNPIGVYENKKYDGIDEVLRTLIIFSIKKLFVILLHAV